MRALITGITGSLGSTVAAQLLLQGWAVEGVSRDEQKQRLMNPDPKLTLHIGDVRDKERMREIMWSQPFDVVFHFAALKCVDTLEAVPSEAWKTNVLGTHNVIQVAKETEVPRLVFTSTDKAVHPVNAYGYSKALAEKMVLASDGVVCRYGNVLASRGSVLPMFVKSLKSERLVRITHGSMTRFFIRLEEAARFVISCADKDAPGVYVPPMRACYITKLANAVADVLNVGIFDREVIGVRPGEKLHEELMTESEGEPLNSRDCEHFSHEDLREYIRPVVERLV